MVANMPEPRGEEDPRAYVRVAAEVRRDIEAGKHPVGKPAPSVTTLSQQSGHARQTVAKAMRMLVDEGLLIRYPGLGYYVIDSGVAKSTGQSQ